MKICPSSVDNLETTKSRWIHVGFAATKFRPEWVGFIVSENNWLSYGLVITKMSTSSSRPTGLIEIIFTLNIYNINLALVTPLCVSLSYFYRLAMEMTWNTCALCGKTIDKPENSVYSEVINGSRFVFDTQSCLEMFRKFQIVYGDTFVAQHALKTWEIGFLCLYYIAATNEYAIFSLN